MDSITSYYQTCMIPAAIQAGIAGIINVPTYRLFKTKVAANCGSTPPILSQARWLKEGLKTSPSLGGSLGLQLGLEKTIEYFFGNPESLWAKTASAAATGFISSPFLAAFNGQMAHQTYWNALRLACKNPVIISMITLRETSFVGALVLADPIHQKVRQHYGEMTGSELIAIGMTSLLGACLGQIPDCVACRLQAKLPLTRVPVTHMTPLQKTIEFLATNTLGIRQRAKAVVVFSTAFHLAEVARKHLA